MGSRGEALPLLDRAADDACCDACRAQPVLAATPGRTVPERPAVARTNATGRATDKRITALAVGMAAGYVALAAFSLFAPVALRQGGWLPLHLVLAGGATTAIAGVMPFFSASVASVAPAAPAIRLAGVAGVALGAAVVTAARAFWSGDPSGALAAVGGLIYLGGIAAVAAATLLPLRRALGTRRVMLAVSYGAALAAVAAGTTIATLFVAGWRPVVEAWDVLKPAHAWLNVVGFVSLVVAASLLHLLPTVAGARIGVERFGRLVILALSVGPLLVALGLATRLSLGTTSGVLVTLVGALLLAWHARGVHARRGRWSSDPSWHGFALASLLAAVAWFVLAVAIAAWGTIEGGASAGGWRPSTFIVPLAVGWVLQSLVGAWTHLVPSIGPGGLGRHAQQRRLLGRLALGRWAVFQAGTASLALGIPLGRPELAIAGALLLVGTAAISLSLLAASLVTAEGQDFRGVAGIDA